MAKGRFFKIKVKKLSKEYSSFHSDILSMPSLQCCERTRDVT